MFLNYIFYTGWAKSCDPNVWAYCGLIINTMNVTNFTEMSYFRQPFENFTKTTQQLIYFLFIFIHFRHFRTFVVSYQQNLFVLFLAYHVLLILKNGVPNFSDGRDSKQKA